MAVASLPPSDHPLALTLRTLGDSGLYAAGSLQAVLGPGKPFALLVYLALTPGRRASREFLLDLLWADLDPERARRALRQMLFYLRRLLGEEVLVGTEELTLSHAIDVDRNRFLAKLEGGETDAAVELYVGHFLPQFGVPGGAAFEHWADLERERLQTAFLRSADLLVRRQLNESRFKEGQRLARRVRDLVPDNEGAWRLVLEAVIAGRDFVAAAVEAEALERWAEAGGITLEASTRALVARARGLSPRAEDDPTVGLMAELTGREREFSAITSAWEAARTGRAKHLHLSAPAGFGKSRLLRDACIRLAAVGARVIQVRGTPGDREVPYAFAADVASAIAALPGSAGMAPASASTLVALNPALSSQFTSAADSAQGEEALRRRIIALVDLVQSVADEQPFVLAIDDLHWIDRPSYRVLEGLFSRLEGTHVLCITAARPERQPVDEGCAVLPLPALTREQLSSLVSALGTLPPHESWSAGFITGLHQATGGSPLLVLETLRLALDQGTLSLERNEWHCLDDERLRSILQAGEALRERVRTLPSAQSWLLALLSTAGTPLLIDPLAHAAGQAPEAFADSLRPLEHQGLVANTGIGWCAAHDEIAAASRTALTAEQRLIADRTIGEYYGRATGTDADDLLRAARHFVSSGDGHKVQQVHRRYAVTARRRGDRRSFGEIAAELIGEESASARVGALVRSLPLAWRFGLWSMARQTVAAGVLLALPLLLLVARVVRHNDEAALQRLVYVDSTGTTSGVLLRPGEWNGTSTPLTPSAVPSTMGDAARTYTGLSPAISPDGRSVAWIKDSGDSTTLDIWIRTPAGTRRLTSQARDDLVQGWLPDGSALIGQTNRWSPMGDADYDIAVFDTATGAARQITHGPAQDNSPFVSPDGTRVAFIRASMIDPQQLCVTTIDGQHEPECRLIGGQPIAWLLGWTGLDELALTTEESGAQPLVRYDWLRDNRTTILAPYVLQPRLSPDRRWVAVSARLDGMVGLRDMVLPIDAPGKARPVAGPGQLRDGLRWWEGKPDRSWLIDHLEFRDSVTTVLPGIGTQLSVKALTATGTEIPIRAPVEWSSGDTSIATVDSTGEIRVRTPGEVQVSATLAGWRKAIKHIKVVGKAPITVLDERWDADWLRRWLPWGDPTPLVTAGPQGIRGLWSRGDGVYPSMAILRDALSARDGLGLEVRISTPLTAAQHQRMKVMFLAGLDPPTFERADHQKAPPTVGTTVSMCGIVFPLEGRWGSTRTALYGSITEALDLGKEALAMRTGAWWTLRVQILPDGRCGIAINGRVLWLSREPVPLDGAYRLWLGDESAGVKLIHGPLQVWKGVRTDIRWTDLAR